MRYLLAVYFCLIVLERLKAADITATLDSSDGSSGFSFRDSTSTEMAKIDSDGNFVLKGGLRLDADGVIKASAEVLIVDGRTGLGVTNPWCRLDLSAAAGAGVNIAKFGESIPIYLITAIPSIGLNAYYDSGWKFGHGSSSDYSGALQFSQDTGAFQIITSTAAGNATDAAIMSARMYIEQDGDVGIGNSSPGAKLDVSGVIHGSVVAGRWTATNHGAAGVVRYQWGTEVFNTDAAYMARTDSNYQITVYKAGYYQINVDVLQYSLADGERGDVYLRVNGGGVDLSLGYGSGQDYYKHILTDVVHLDANDTVDVQNASASANCYANGDAWSVLSISRLN
ncbi:MAG: hypothetical protein PHQ23_03610 [Candidatus Wallbacteria bacterium]|nr:hypothetical protein [Candidatus Wallbacteria bacterium]